MSITLNIKRKARLFLYVVVFASALALVFVDSFRAEAEIILFNALSIEHQVTSADDDLVKEYEYVWSAFTGVVPEGGSVEHVTFTASWIQSTTTQVTEEWTDATVSPVSDEEPEAQTEMLEPVELVPEPVVESGGEPVVPEDIPQSTIQNTEEVVDFPQIESEENAPSPEIFEEAPSLPIESVDVLPDINDQASVTGFPLVRKSETYPFAQEDVLTEPGEITSDTTFETEEIPPPMLDTPEDVAPAEATQPIIPEAMVTPVLDAEIISDESVEEGGEVDDTMYEVLTEVSTPTEVVSLGSSYVDEVDAGESVLETETIESANFAYSFDGIEWFTLGTANLLTLSEISFDISQISLEAIPSLRIRVRYHASSSVPEILFEKPQLALSYTPGVIEEPVIIGDQEPNFLVSSIYADVVDGTTRAVLLERGGLFELWVHATEHTTGLPLWTRLMSSGVASQDIPISVKERTVFWFDPQIQSLYVFGIDEKSLKIVQPLSPGDSRITAPIGKSNKNWTVVFDIASQTFTFIRNSTSSI